MKLPGQKLIERAFDQLPNPYEDDLEIDDVLGIPVQTKEPLLLRGNDEFRESNFIAGDINVYFRKKINSNGYIFWETIGFFY